MDAPLNLPPLNIPTLLRANGLTLKKSLGQNFLSDPSILERIVHAAEIPPDHAVLEVGPGLGSLTRYLACAARRVVAVELDESLLTPLEQVLAGFSNVEIVHGDILEVDPAQLIQEDSYLVVANIPYYITSNLIRHLLEARIKPRRLLLTIQREVAERITASAGDMSLLALSVQVYGTPKIALRIPAGAFYPPPKVDSSAVRVDLFEQPIIPPENLGILFHLAKAGFGQKRKTLRNSISAGLRWSGDRTAALLQAVGIDPQRRAETLSVAEWGWLAAEYKKQSLGFREGFSGSDS